MRRFLKQSILLFFVLLVAPLLALYKFCSLFSITEYLFQGFSQFISLFPGRFGAYIRSSFYRYTLKKCTSNVTISFGAFFPNRNVAIGEHVYIGANCIIADSVIEDDVMLGSSVHVVSGGKTHNFDDIETPMRLQGGKSVPIRIGEDSWIGNGAIIMANIGKKCIIGAGSVVTKDIDDFSVAVGNPAKVIRTRL